MHGSIVFWGQWLAASAIGLTVAMRWLQRWTRQRAARSHAIGFLHPHCASGGGGERVLWSLVHAVAASLVPGSKEIVIYCSSDLDEASLPSLLESVNRNFGLGDALKNIIVATDSGDSAIRLMPLRMASLAQAETWPRFTLLGQALGSVACGIEIALRCPPSFFIDTSGFAFAYPVLSVLLGVPIACYVHFPMIHADMTHAVECGRESVNNRRQLLTRFSWGQKAKLWYYGIMANAYKWAGSTARGNVIVNSSWTGERIADVWALSSVGDFKVIFPPVDVARFSHTDDQHAAERKNWIVSCAQFRPEKNQERQIRIMKELRRKRGEALPEGMKLIVCGSTRNDDDRKLVENLQGLARTLGVEDVVEFRVNIGVEELASLMRGAKAALHTMEDEHFGIAIVEFLAAGLVVVTHASGGPKSDILAARGEESRSIGGCMGFVAKEDEEFADCLWLALTDYDNKSSIVGQKREFASREFPRRFFDEEAFAAKCVDFWGL